MSCVELSWKWPGQAILAIRGNDTWVNTFLDIIHCEPCAVLLGISILFEGPESTGGRLFQKIGRLLLEHMDCPSSQPRKHKSLRWLILPYLKIRQPPNLKNKVMTELILFWNSVYILTVRFLLQRLVCYEGMDCLDVIVDPPLKSQPFRYEWLSVPLVMAASWRPREC